MKVEFSVEEVQVMAHHVVDQLLDLDGLGRSDKAALRRWRSEELKASARTMRLLAEKVNAELQQVHASAEVPKITKPDWL